MTDDAADAASRQWANLFDTDDTFLQQPGLPPRSQKNVELIAGRMRGQRRGDNLIPAINKNKSGAKFGVGFMGKLGKTENKLADGVCGLRCEVLHGVT